MYRTFFLFLMALLSLTAPLGATVIYVSGDQTGTWSADTVIVTAEVRVPPGQSLTILPSVEVLFSVYCKLIVDSAATLRAVGTAADSIRFDVLLPDSSWHGIRFLSASDSSRLEYCYLTHGCATGSGGDESGGAISCLSSSPAINNNTISRNGAEGSSIWEPGLGGGIYCVNSSPTISYNIISGNSALNGGGIYCSNSSPSISGNTISRNSAFNPVVYGYGGGICCGNNSSPTISGNTISGNSVSGSGGGIRCDNSSPSISGNTISRNSNWGIICAGGSPTFSGNTISGNSDGGISGGVSSFTLVNCIIWGNQHCQIYVQSGSPQVTYSDIQGGYPGTGNIDAWPAFVDTAQGDYRLQWASPCIDSGDPNPIYNDPDLTRADMGAWYYDQTMPVRILLTPYNAPIQIPASGGSFQYAIQVTNIGSTTLPILVWCDVTLPSGTIYGPVLGPLIITLVGQTLSRLRTQAVPAGAPAGLYHYNAYAVAAGDTSEDGFTFVKLGGGGWSARTPSEDLGAGGWTNTGEDFTSNVGASAAADCAPVSGSEATPTMEVAPNPFNPTTAISFNLPQAGWVKLEVFDIAGRNVGAHCMRPEGLGTRSVPLQAGTHQITFDGSGLPSGIYFAKLEAGDYSHVQKLILLK